MSNKSEKSNYNVKFPFYSTKFRNWFFCAVREIYFGFLTESDWKAKTYKKEEFYLLVHEGLLKWAPIVPLECPVTNITVWSRYLRKLYFLFLSLWMGYDRGDNFPYDFKPNGIPFGSENRKENCHHDHIPFNVKGNGNSFLSV